MEPIRPDDDELRADDRPAGTEKKKPEGERAGPSGGPGGASKSPANGGGAGRSGGNALLWLLLIVVAGGAGAGWYWQNERLAVVESQLEEAESWARQSKLALARFEGELSETGSSLQERGESLEDTLAGHGQRLDNADSEIGKLWVVANERNKARLDDQQQRLGDVDQTLVELNKAVSDVSATLEQARSSLSGDMEQLRQRVENSVVALERADQQVSEQLAGLEQRMDDVGELVDTRVRRFEQEQRLGNQGLESRLSSLEVQVDAMADGSQVGALRGELETLQETVEAIDASRSQLTSRLIRLSEEVNDLRSQ